VPPGTDKFTLVESCAIGTEERPPLGTRLWRASKADVEGLTAIKDKLVFDIDMFILELMFSIRKCILCYTIHDITNYDNYRASSSAKYPEYAKLLHVNLVAGTDPKFG
jgi:hypothetical protein